MSLAVVQRQLADLLAAGAPPTEAQDPYVRRVAASPHLNLLREIIASWQILGIEGYCRLTRLALLRQGRFEETVRAFLRGRIPEPLTDELGHAFLAAVARSADPLLASVAAFERALVKAQDGAPGQWTIRWSSEPYATLDALLRGARLPADDGPYTTVVSSTIPRRFRVDRES